MKPIGPIPNLVERVRTEISDAILSGDLKPGEHLVQEDLARHLGVSRQPVQQAMTLLRADGLAEEAGKRGLVVARLDAERMEQHYGVRAVLDAHAAAETARRLSTGLVDRDEFRGAVDRVLADGASPDQTMLDRIRHDEAFHRLIYDHCGNPVVAEAAEPSWRFLRRAMAEVLRRASLPRAIWDEHRAIAEAILEGDASRAADLAQSHARAAALALSAVLRQDEMREA